MWGHYQKGTFSIDFGTVNTTVYFASDTGDCQAVAAGQQGEAAVEGRQRPGEAAAEFYFAVGEQ